MSTMQAPRYFLPEGSQLPELVTELDDCTWYYDRGSNELLRRQKEGGYHAYLPAFDFGPLLVHQVIRFRNEDMPEGQRVVFDLSIGGERHEVSFGELHWRAWTGKWGGLGIGSRATLSRLAGAIEQIAWLTNAPHVAGPRGQA